MKKFIFVDFDGVILPYPYMREMHRICQRGNRCMKRECVKVLDDIISTDINGVGTEPVVYIIGSWALETGENIRQGFKFNGMGMSIESDFKSIKGNRVQRVSEILASNPSVPYVILDDEDFGWPEPLRSHWVKPNKDIGLSANDYHLACEILNK